MSLESFEASVGLVVLTLVAWWMVDDRARADSGPRLCYRGDCLC